MKNKSILFLVLGISAFVNLENVSASEIGSALFLARPMVSSAQYNEQKFLSERCRMIKIQAYSCGGGFGSGNIHLAIEGIENFLYGIGTPLAFQMLGDLQQAGYSNFEAWCSRYGV